LCKVGQPECADESIDVGGTHRAADGFGLYVLAVSKLSVGTAAAVSTSYVLLVVLLSRMFLGESLIWLKIAGILLTTAGVALLSLEEL
jgi:drug/metabolite transporter (DMT)-like permease